MRWQRILLPDFMTARGDACYGACAGNNSYAVSYVEGYGITATWKSLATPRLGTESLPVGDSYPERSPLVHAIGDKFPTIHLAQQACEAHRKGSLS